MWENLAFAPLVCLLFAGQSPAALGQGMEWVLEAAEDATTPQEVAANRSADEHRPVVGDRGPCGAATRCLRRGYAGF